jgi:pimeloyl-ACP methyl ester carboxylesterase
MAKPKDDHSTEGRSRAMTRRRLIQGLAAAVGPAAFAARPRASAIRDANAWHISNRSASSTAQGAANPGPYRQEILPRGIRSRFVENVNGLRMHVLEAGFDPRNWPAVLLLHGFPELAYSWRRVMPPLASAGFHVIAPDLRGYGRTSGTDVRYDDDLGPFRTLNEVRDIVGLVSAFGYRSVSAVIGHDFGSPVAAWCSVVRPDMFRSVVLMSAPFAGPPAAPFDTADGPAASNPRDTLYDDLATLKPPRKHYQRYYGTREANDNMQHARQGVHAFLRAYYHMKSADWKQNKPFPLKARTAEEFAKLPRYYVMDLDRGMAEQVAPEMPSASEIASCKWLPDEELRVYSEEYGRTGFQGGLQGYRVGASGRFTSELQTFSGRTIDTPSMFIAGKSDWGAYQNPGALDRMQKTACTQMVATHFVDGAGHWVQQEQADEVSRLLLQFLQQKAPRQSGR